MCKNITYMYVRNGIYKESSTLDLSAMTGLIEIDFHNNNFGNNIYLPLNIQTIKLRGDMGNQIYFSDGIATSSQILARDTCFPVALKYVELELCNLNFWQSLRNCTSLSRIYSWGGNFNSGYLKSLAEIGTNNIKSISIVSVYSGKGGSISLENLKYQPNLTYVELSRFSTVTTADLSSLTKLTSFTLVSSNLLDISFLEECTSLTTLNLSDNNIVNLYPLRNLKNLTTLYLNTNAIYDTASVVNGEETIVVKNLEIISGLHSSNGGKLNSIYLAGNSNILDFSPLSKLSWSNKSGF